MKTNCWLILGTMLATSAVAQVNTNALPPIPAPVIAPVPATVAPVMATNETKVAPVKKTAPVKHKKKITAKPVAKKIAEAPVTLVPGPATVNAENVNYRGQAGLKGEAIGHLKKGDSITVLAQINLDKHAADEPAQWAKIALPAGTKVWVNAKFIDATNKVVAVKKLNLRAGPGENYSVLGVLERGASVTETSAKGDWTQIETPTNAFAFVAASYLKQEAAVEPVPVVTPAVPLPPETTNTVAEPQPIVTQPTTIPASAETTVPAAVVVPSVIAPVTETNLPPPPPRVITHEGWVRSSVSPVAPTHFELYDPTSGKAINYLYATTTNLNLSYYNGLQIVVTGEEGLDARWQDTPVLTVQRIYVLSTNVPETKRVASPRASQRH